MTARRIIGFGIVAGMLAAAPAAHAAGFFDDFARAFLGAPQRAAAPAAVDLYEPLNVTVKPQRQAYPEVSSKPKPPVVQLDPSSDPNWYLKDPTLRRGDIVVTAGGVKVYQGRDADMLAKTDFTALGGKPGDKGWKGQLQTAAAGGRTFFRDGGVPPKTATASLGDQPIETATR